MRTLLLLIASACLVSPAAIAGKDIGGALVVHADESYGWRGDPCPGFYRCTRDL